MEYLSAGEAGYYVRNVNEIRSGVRLRLRVAEGMALNALELDELVFYLDGVGETAERLYELLLGNTHSLVLRCGNEQEH
ncbi:MAG: type VI secretion system baseplate subunit TssF [Thiolinea sp.]